MKFEMPEMIELIFDSEIPAFGPEGCSARWTKACCYKE